MKCKVMLKVVALAKIVCKPSVSGTLLWSDHRFCPMIYQLEPLLMTMRYE